MVSGCALLEVKVRLSLASVRCQWLSGRNIFECLALLIFCPKKPIMDILWILWIIPTVIAVEGKIMFQSHISPV